MSTSITIGTIEQPMVPGRKLMRPNELPHKDFMLMQKSDWPEFHRVILGKWENVYHTTKEIEWWCNSNIHGRWFHSDSNEVYYFEDQNSAIHFKLRWFSEIAQQAN